MGKAQGRLGRVGCGHESRADYCTDGSAERSAEELREHCDRVWSHCRRCIGHLEEVRHRPEQREQHDVQEHGAGHGGLPQEHWSGDNHTAQ